MAGKKVTFTFKAQYSLWAEQYRNLAVSIIKNLGYDVSSVKLI